ncbi:MAG: hypothetical protein KKA42_13010 [candidate division Zixibacteria bacterium]|nr:hypothetical protein [candidate division Zixibacteria bacterium]
MEKHVSVLGILFIVFGAMGLFASLIVLVFLGGLGVAIGAESGDEEVVLALGLVGTIMMLIGLVSSLPGIVAGWGLLRHKSWARILTIILSILILPGFPIGTALGIYGLWAMFNEEAERMFSPTPRPVVHQPPQPTP